MNEAIDPLILLYEAREEIANICDRLQCASCNHGPVKPDCNCRTYNMSIMIDRIDKALGIEDDEDIFQCCGGSDETPREHTQDCSKHPPLCFLCKERRAVCVAANGDAYEARCTDCLLHERDTARKYLAQSSMDGIVKCEFCKGSGSVPYKKPWSPRDVLGNENE